MHAEIRMSCYEMSSFIYGWMNIKDLKMERWMDCVNDKKGVNAEISADRGE